VPELRFDNDAPRKVLLVDGEELVGARQNRILNLTILVGAGQKLVIPVSCVERGRWAWRSREFASAKRHLFAKARAAKMRHVTASMSRSGAHRADQGQVWQSISDKASRLRAASPTEAMSDIYAQRKDTLAGYESAFTPSPGQVGAVFAVNGRIAGAELFDSAATFAKLLDKLVGSYALDAIEEEAPADTVPSLEEVRAFLKRMQQAAAERFAALGEGEDLRLTGEKLAGGALLAEGRVVHLAAFPLDEAPAGSDSF
jgi:hypothetical protein